MIYQALIILVSISSFIGLRIWYIRQDKPHIAHDHKLRHSEHSTFYDFWKIQDVLQCSLGSGYKGIGWWSTRWGSDSFQRWAWWNRQNNKPSPFTGDPDIKRIPCHTSFLLEDESSTNTVVVVFVRLESVKTDMGFISQGSHSLTYNMWEWKSFSEYDMQLWMALFQT